MTISDVESEAAIVAGLRQSPCLPAVPFARMCAAARIERERLGRWRQNAVLPVTWFSRRRLFSFFEVLILSLLARHDDECRDRDRLRAVASTLIEISETAARLAVAPSLLPMACVHVIMRDADDDAYAEAAAAARSFDPSFLPFESYADYRRACDQDGSRLVPELIAAVDRIDGSDLWDLQQFCDLLDLGSSGMTALLTFDFHEERLIRTYEIGTALPENLDGDEITRLTMIPLAPALRRIEETLAAPRFERA